MKMRTNHLPLLMGALLLCAAAAAFWGPAPRAAAQRALLTSGRVGEFRPATPISPGVLSIGSLRAEIHPGTVLEGQEQIRIGATMSLKATMDDEDRVVVPSSIATQDAGSIGVCGRVRTWWPSTYATPGRLTLDAGSWAIAPGIELRGAMQLSPEADVCVSAALNAAGQISYPNSVTASVTNTLQICGRVTAWSPSTASAQGALAIEGLGFTLARGAKLPAGIAIGANLCLTLCLNRNGEVFEISTQGGNSGGASLCAHSANRPAALSARPFSDSRPVITHTPIAGS